MRESSCVCAGTLCVAAMRAAVVRLMPLLVSPSEVVLGSMAAASAFSWYRSKFVPPNFSAAKAQPTAGDPKVTIIIDVMRHQKS